MKVISIQPIVVEVNNLYLWILLLRLINMKALQLLCLSFVLFLVSASSLNAQFIVSDTASALTLVNTLVGNGVTISNATLYCPTISKGTFERSTTLTISKGIVLTSGNVVSAPGVYSGIDTAAEGFASIDPDGDPFSTLYDTQLDSLVYPNNTYNACALEFDFIPIDSFFSFKYVFASEEYPEYACTPFNDVFAFFINGPGYAGNTNLALVPGTSIPVTINSINENNPMVDTFPNLNDTSYCRAMGPGSPFNIYYRDNSSGLELVYDGLTTVLTASEKVSPCRTYHMKIAIADVGDEGYDSGVFLEENSFSSGASMSSHANRDTASVYLSEGCEDGRFVIRTPSIRSSSQTFSLSYGGNAISGVDYTPLPISITIPAYRDTASISVHVLSDIIFEPHDTIKLYVINPCTFLPYDSAILIIRDLIPDTNNYAICTGRSLFLGGALRTGVGAWRDTLNNVLGCDSFFVSKINAVAPFFTTSFTSSICTGDSILFNGLWRKIPALYRDTLLTSAGCDSFVNMTLSNISLTGDSLNISICSGDSFNFNGRIIRTAGIYRDTLASHSGCDSVVTLQVANYTFYATSVRLRFCANDLFVIGGHVIDSSGTYYDTLSTVHGCDSVVTFNISVSPISTSFQNLTICPSDSVLLAGAYRSLPGVYYDTLVSYRSCDSIRRTNLSIYTVRYDSSDYNICAGDSLLINGIYQNSSGYYLTHHSDAHGCDSIFYSHLNVYPLATDSSRYSICQNDSVFISSIWVKTAGAYIDTLSSIHSCDSFYVSIVNVTPIQFYRTIDICFGDSVLVSGSYHHTGGIFYDSLISNATGCDSILSTKLAIHPLPVIDGISNDTTLCSGKFVTLQVNSSGAYLWSNGLTMSTISVSPSSDQIYYVTVTDSYGCRAIASVAVKVLPLPNISLANEFDLCLGQSVHISLSSMYTYFWSDGSTDSNRIFTPNIDHSNYTVTVSNTAGCEKTYATTINLNLSDINILVNPGDTIELGTTITLTAHRYDLRDSIIVWLPSYAQLDSHSLVIKTTPQVSGFYHVISISPYGCIYEDSIYIFVLNPDTIAIPTAFSPNGDGVNDLFRPILSSYLQLSTFQIYDRWGILVYDAHEEGGSTRGWDGNYKNRPQPLSTFVFYVEAVNILTGKKIRKSGNVTLLR
jgi:gliding motility-associated-like protein